MCTQTQLAMGSTGEEQSECYFHFQELPQVLQTSLLSFLSDCVTLFGVLTVKSWGFQFELSLPV